MPYNPTYVDALSKVSLSLEVQAAQLDTRSNQAATNTHKTFYEHSPFKSMLNWNNTDQNLSKNLNAFVYLLLCNCLQKFLTKYLLLFLV